MFRGKFLTIARYLRMMYAVAALSGSVILHTCAGPIVHAQSKDDFVAQEKVDVNARLIDSLQAAQADMSHRMDAQAQRQNELSDRISIIQGIGTGVLGVLGVLQVFGLIATSRAAKASS